MFFKVIMAICLHLVAGSATTSASNDSEKLPLGDFCFKNSLPLVCHSFYKSSILYVKDIVILTLATVMSCAHLRLDYYVCDMTGEQDMTACRWAQWLIFPQGPLGSLVKWTTVRESCCIWQCGDLVNFQTSNVKMSCDNTASLKTVGKAVRHVSSA